MGIESEAVMSRITTRIIPGSTLVDVNRTTQPSLGDGAGTHGSVSGGAVAHV